MAKKSKLWVDVEIIHRDYQTISAFIHTQETFKDGLTEYTDNLFEQLSDAAWNDMSEEERGDFDQSVKIIDEIMNNVCNRLERKIKNLV